MYDRIAYSVTNTEPCDSLCNMKKKLRISVVGRFSNGSDSWKKKKKKNWMVIGR